MTPQQILDDLKSTIPAGTSLTDALVTFMKNFDETEVAGCNKATEGDMLLYQWGGPYSWDPCFSINLTRQFTFEGEDSGYEGMEQLSMDCRYEADLVSLESGNIWFDGTDITSFIEQVLSSDAVRAVSGLEMKSLDFELSEV